MADELTLLMSMSFVKSGMDVAMTRSDKVTVSGSKYQHGVQTIGNTAEALDLGDTGTSGYIFLYNKDTADTVCLRIGASGADTVELPPGEMAMFRLAASTPYLLITAPTPVSESATADVEYLLIED